jgi:hypothetical protein
MTRPDAVLAAALVGFIAISAATGAGRVVELFTSRNWPLKLLTVPPEPPPLGFL